MPYSADKVRQALSKERLGGTCLINFCAGGETLLSPQVLEYAYELINEGHYIMIVTNATINDRFDEIAQWPKQVTSHLFFKFSYHYLQLKEHNLLDRFFENVQKARDAGCSYTIEITPNDELIPYVDECIDLCIKQAGATPHITIGRDENDPTKLPILTKMPTNEYYEFWGDKFKSTLFDYKKELFGVPRKEFCYAGMYSACIDMQTGDMYQCYKSTYTQNIFYNISKPIKWIPIGRCLDHHCYNGHAWIVLGDIPQLSIKAPTFSDVRNRVCNDGSEWLQPQMKEFMNSRTCDNNEELSKSAQAWFLLRNKLARTRIIHRLFDK